MGSPEREVEGRIRDLEAQVPQLRLDNQVLAERHIDATLLGLLSERISAAAQPREVLLAGLECASALLGLSACVVGELTERGLSVREAYLASGHETLEGQVLALPPSAAADAAARPVILFEDERELLGAWPEALVSLRPVAALAVPAPSRLLPQGVLLCIDTMSEAHLRSALPILQRVVEAIGARVDNLLLLSDLARLTASVEDRVAARTRALVDAEQRLRRSEVLAAESRDPILFVRANDGCILDANGAATRLYGYSLEEFRALTVIDLRAPTEQGVAGRFLSAVDQQGILFETVHRRRDGADIPVEVSARAIDFDGTKTIISVIRDASERRAAAEALHRSEERFRVAFATSPDSMNLTRLDDGICVAVNQGFTRVTGWTEADVLGRSSLDLGIWVDPADRQRLVDGLRADGVVENLEARFRFKDGRIILGLMSARIIVLDRIPHILSVTRDITVMRQAEAERNRLAEQLSQSQKLEAIGQLAGGMAHDFNNLLTVILSCAWTLKSELPAGQEQLLDDLLQIEEAGERARELTGQLLAFARKQPVVRSSVDLNRVVKASEKLLRRVLGEHISLQVALEPGLWWLLSDVGQLEQVILNLAINARDAMPDGGTLFLSTSNMRSAAPGPASAPDTALGEFVRLLVRDTGTGMSPAVQDRLFEPFFTTKGAGRGTGLGLATVYGIVKQWGGFIRVESAPGAGSLFEIGFPRTQEAPASDSLHPDPLETGGTETILLVEDEPAVRRVAARALLGGGYRVLVAGSGHAALRLLEDEPQPIDLLVTDVIMPGMNGRVLASQLRSRGAATRVLFISGYALDLVGKEGMLANGEELLAKPFTAEGLLARVRAVLDAPRSD